MDCKELIVIEDEPFNELLPLQVKPPESVFVRRRNQIPGEVIANPQWLPNGWITELKIRKSGLTAGHVDKYYLEPVNGTKFRSRVEVTRFLETGSRHKPKSITNAHAQSDHPTSRPVYYYRPVLCQSPLYAEHPGLYPVIYFPIIGNSENRFSNPPMEFLQNFGDLKPFFAQPSNIPSPSICQNDLFREAFGPQNNQRSKILSKRNPCHTFSENVSGEAELKAPPSSSLHETLRPHENSQPVSNATSPDSLALSCDISSFTVTTEAGKDHQCSPNSVLEQHCGWPIASQTKPCSAQMRGQLSAAQLNSFNLNLKPSSSTGLESWEP